MRFLTGTFSQYVVDVHASENHFVYVPLSASLARRIVEQLNLAGPTKLYSEPSGPRGEDERVERIYREWLSNQWDEYALNRDTVEEQVAWSGRRTPTMGYVTRDACPGVGDDIEHIPGERNSQSPVSLRADETSPVPHSHFQPYVMKLVPPPDR